MSSLPVDPDALREQVRDKYREVAVDPGAAFHFHTGRGLASRVTSGVAADLLARGLRTIALNVDQRHVPAIHIYERIGFARYCAFLEGSAGAADRSAGSL